MNCRRLRITSAAAGAALGGVLAAAMACAAASAQIVGDRALALRGSHSAADLVAALADSSEALRTVAARRLACLGTTLAEHQTALVAALETESGTDARYALAFALGRYADSSAGVDHALGRALADSSQRVRIGAAYALSLRGQAGLQALIDSSASEVPMTALAATRALGDWLPLTPTDAEVEVLGRLDARPILVRLDSYPPVVALGPYTLAEGESAKHRAYHDLWRLVQFLRVPTEDWLPIAERTLEPLPGQEPHFTRTPHELLAARFPETRRVLERAWSPSPEGARGARLAATSFTVDRAAIRELVEAAVRGAPGSAPAALSVYGESAVPELSRHLASADSASLPGIIEALLPFPSGRDTLRAWLPTLRVPFGGAREYGDVWAEVDPEGYARSVRDSVMSLSRQIDERPVEPGGFPWTVRYNAPLERLVSLDLPPRPLRRC